MRRRAAADRRLWPRHAVGHDRRDREGALDRCPENRLSRGPQDPAPRVQHKSERDGVRLALPTGSHAAAYDDMAARWVRASWWRRWRGRGSDRPRLVNDREFVPICLAAGGIWIEVLRDRVVALPRYRRRGGGAGRCLRIRPLLDGRRGLPPATSPMHRAISRLSVLPKISAISSPRGTSTPSSSRTVRGCR